MDNYQNYILTRMRDEWERQRVPSPYRMLLIVKDIRCDLKDLAFLKDCLYYLPEREAMLALRILCNNGGKISDYLNCVSKTFDSVRNQMMLMAEEQGDAETVVNLMENHNLNLAIQILCRMKKEEYLAPFLLNCDEELREVVCKIVERNQMIEEERRKHA